MRVGCDLPYFEDPAAIRAFARGAEQLGLHHLGFSEHLAGTGATTYHPPIARDDPWHECFTLVSFLAAVTERIELTSGMLLLALRPAVLAAKQAAEADLLCGGRLRLGVAAGWNEAECEALGVDPATRGRRLEEQVEVLRRLWQEDVVSFEGRHVHLDRVGIHPRPRRRIPLWLGAGRLDSGGIAGDVALDRVARLGDGYKLMAPTGFDLAVALEQIARARAAAARAGRRVDGAGPVGIGPGERFGIEARLVAHVTPPQDWARFLAAYREAGATHVGIANRIAGGGVQQQLDLVARIVEATRDEWGDG